jgi:hypothetical protein
MSAVPLVFENAGLASVFQKQALEKMPLKKQGGEYVDIGLKKEDILALVTRIKGTLGLQ